MLAQLHLQTWESTYPANVAVHEPNTWVGGVEGDNEETRRVGRGVGWHNGNITARWVVKLERGGVRVSTKALREDQEVVTVKMDRMGKWDHALDDHVHPLAEVGHLDGKVARGIWNGAVVDDALEGRVLPLRVEGGARQSPLEEVGVAVVWPDNDRLFDGLVRSARAPRNDGHKAGRRLVQASWCVLLRWRVDIWRSVRTIGVMNDTLDVEVLELAARLLVVSAHPVVS